MFYKIKKWFLTIFGDIKYYKFPMFLIYCPTTYKCKGENYLEVRKIIKPGDIILRGYDDYVDGLFIPNETGYTHSGIYIGDDIVIHSVAEGVCNINLIDFMRADRIMVMEPRSDWDRAVEIAKDIRDKDTGYDFDFDENNGSFYCHELTAYCYEPLHVEKKLVKKFFGLYKKYMYLAESFITNSNFRTIYEFNLKK